MNHTIKEPLAREKREVKRSEEALRRTDRQLRPEGSLGLPAPDLARISRRYSFDDNGGGYQGL